MIAVFFEVSPADEKWNEYPNIAKKLRPAISMIGGFISIGRYHCFANPDKILSLSFWKGENSIEQWRNIELYRQA